MTEREGVQESPSFGAVLRQSRVAAGLTQETLAERSGLGIRSIQGLERGETRPRRETLRRLTQALGLTSEQAATFERAGQASPREHQVWRREERPPSMAALHTSHEDRQAESALRHNLPVQLTTFVGGSVSALT